MSVNVAYQADREGPLSLSRVAPFEVEQLGRHLGAEVHGLNLKNGWDPDTFRAFEAALIEHKVLVVRDPVGHSRRRVRDASRSRGFGCPRRIVARRPEDLFGVARQ